MQRKGQAAMEFLMTYGWAILAAVIAIGVLAYFGVFNPGRFMPKACTLTAPLGCDDSRITTNNVDLVIRNGAGETVTITSINITGCVANDTIITLNTGATTSIFPIACTTGSSKFRGELQFSVCWHLGHGRG